MFYVCAIDANKIHIKDTQDGVVDALTVQQVQDAVNHGFRIHGVEGDRISVYMLPEVESITAQGVVLTRSEDGGSIVSLRSGNGKNIIIRDEIDSDSLHDAGVCTLVMAPGAEVFNGSFNGFHGTVDVRSLSSSDAQAVYRQLASYGFFMTEPPFDVLDRADRYKDAMDMLRLCGRIYKDESEQVSDASMERFLNMYRKRLMSVDLGSCFVTGKMREADGICMQSKPGRLMALLVGATNLSLPYIARLIGYVTCGGKDSELLARYEVLMRRVSY